MFVLIPFASILHVTINFEIDMALVPHIFINIKMNYYYIQINLKN